MLQEKIEAGITSELTTPSLMVLADGQLSHFLESTTDDNLYRRAVNEMFLCRLCNFLVYPFYTHCKFGHPMCSFCLLLREEDCPDCKTGFLQDMLHTLPFPCYYKNFGCSQMIEARFWHNHVSSCLYSPYRL